MENNSLFYYNFVMLMSIMPTCNYTTCWEVDDVIEISHIGPYLEYGITYEQNKIAYNMNYCYNFLGQTSMDLVWRIFNILNNIYLV